VERYCKTGTELTQHKWEQDAGIIVEQEKSGRENGKRKLLLGRNRNTVGRMRENA
jgi:hypothetical protein